MIIHITCTYAAIVAPRGHMVAGSKDRYARRYPSNNPKLRVVMPQDPPRARYSGDDVSRPNNKRPHPHPQRWDDDVQLPPPREVTGQTPGR